MRVLIEVAFLTSGLIAAYVIAWLAAWSYPRATDETAGFDDCDQTSQKRTVQPQKDCRIRP